MSNVHKCSLLYRAKIVIPPSVNFINQQEGSFGLLRHNERDRLWRLRRRRRRGQLCTEEGRSQITTALSTGLIDGTTTAVHSEAAWKRSTNNEEAK